MSSEPKSPIPPGSPEGVGKGAVPRGSLGFELDLSSRPPPAPDRKSSSTPPAHPGGDRGFELDLGSTPPPAHRAPPQAALPTALVGASSRAGIAAGADHGFGRAAIDDRLARELAAYDAAPTSLVRALPYALSVWRRRRELRASHARQTQVHVGARSLLRRRIAAVIDEAAARRPDVVEALLVAARDADQRIQQMTAELQATESTLASQLEDIEQHHVRLDQERKQRQRDRDMARIHVEDAKDKLRAEQLAYGRLGQRLAAARTAAEEAARVGDEYAPPEHARAIVRLQTEQTAAARQVAGREAALTRAGAELAEREAAIRDADARIAQLASSRNATHTHARSAHAGGLARIEQADELKLDAYERALATLNREHRDVLSREQHARVDEIYAELGANDALLERHLRAIDAYDKAAYARGVALAVALALAVLVGLIASLRVG